VTGTASEVSDLRVVHDPRFAAYVPDGARLTRLHGDMRWAEGPVWRPASGDLLWSDIPNNRMYRLAAGGTIGVFRDPSHFSNGNTLDREGRLITCEQSHRAISRTDAAGHIDVLVDSYEERRFNSPNDAVVAADGAIWFSDPPYGILSDSEGVPGEMEYGGCFVFRFDPATGDLTVVADDFDKPNGLAFSPDERRLYVADSGASHDPAAPHHVRVFDVVDGVGLRGGSVFADIRPGVPDGLRLDVDGNVWISAADGIHCYAPDGVLLGKLLVPETVANLEFGGSDRRRLFITATTSLYSITLHQAGVART